MLQEGYNVNNVNIVNTAPKQCELSTMETEL
jgi:hypothetical protein